MTPTDDATSVFHQCWFLTGATACGKTAVSLALAQRLPIEIVAMDSMTLYRGMDVGTGKPSHDERAAVRCHLFDVLDPSEPASVHWYLETARDACEEILQRGRRPLFVGGTPLYLKALLRGMFPGPPADFELRKRWQVFADEQGCEALHARLTAVDPTSAQRLPANDVRRIIRALEVYDLTGIPISSWQRQFDRPADPPPPVACLQREREELYARIHRRIDEMLDAGWIAEVQTLLAAERPMGREASQAAGYREIAEHLAGRLTTEEMAALIRQRTRRLAKHQQTWFRHLEELRFIPLEADDSAEQIADRLVPFFRTDAKNV